MDAHIYKEIIDNVPYGVVIIDEKGDYLDVNKAACIITGYTAAELVTMNVSDLLNAEDTESFEGQLKELESNSSSEAVFRFKTKNSDERLLKIRALNIGSKRYVGFAEDVTEQFHATRVLKESEAQYRSSFKHSSLGMGYYDLDGKVISFNNKGIKNMPGVPADYIGKSIFEIHSHEYAEIFMERIRDVVSREEPQTYESLLKEPQGSRWLSSTYSRVMDEEGKVTGVQVVALDITKQKNMEIEKERLALHLRNQQKLESVGTLASGVAHEINNPINGILNYGQIILDADIGDPSIKDYAQQIINETNRVSEIVKNLLDFSRQKSQEHSYARIEEIISNTLSLINTVLKRDQIEFNLDMDEDMPHIKCRSQQIQQVIMNLVTNARDSINEKYPKYNENKKINLTCRAYVLNGRKWIRLVVEDFGLGISKDAIDKIFDPFFTTKGRTDGTGLGLYISLGIVKEHHGEMTVESEEGKFTRFIVNLPCDHE